MYFLCPLIFLTTLQTRQTTSKLKLPWTLLRIKTASACCYQHQLFSMKKNERLQRDRMGAARYFRVHNRASNEHLWRLREALLSQRRPWFKAPTTAFTFKTLLWLGCILWKYANLKMHFSCSFSLEGHLLWTDIP